MTYQPLHRRPRWHDRPRAWLRGILGTISGREEEHALTDDHGNHIGEDLPDYEYDDQPQVIRTAKVSGVHLPLSGDPNPWAPCAFRQDVPRPGSTVGEPVAGTGPGCQQHPLWARGGLHEIPSGVDCLSGTGRPYLSAFAVPFGAPGHIPPTPRPPAAVTWTRPRLCAGRIALLAGA